MRRCLTVAMLLGLLGLAKAYGQDIAKEFPQTFALRVTNPLNLSRENVLVFVAAPQLKKMVPDFNSKAFVVLDGGKEIPSQYTIQDQPGIMVVLDKMNAAESRELTVRFNKSGTSQRTYAKRTQAELSHKTGGEWKNREYIGGAFQNVDYLRVPPQHKDHSWFIRYEGPGWESDKVGYRFYLDQRNATDVFGKKVPDMILHTVGQDGFDSYHNMQPWGMDVMKVGNSLGVGSIGALHEGKAVRVEKTDSVNCRITENGNLYAAILTHYYGWQVGNKKHDVESRIGIHAGSHVTQQTLTISGNPDNVCTGIGKDKNATLITQKGDAQHLGYMATFGKQSLNNDALGLAVFFHPKAVIAFAEDQYSHIVTLKPSQGKVQYYFLATWELEPQGIKDQQQFAAYLERVSQELAHPVKAEILKTKK